MFPRAADDSRIPESCSSRRPDQCGFSGNSDLYGLGIRLGIYLQLLAMTLAMVLFGKKGHDQVVTYNVFILSCIIALFVISFTDGCVFEVELIMLQYIIWSGFATILMWIYLVFGEDGASRKGTGTVAGLCLYPILGYGFYFWLGIVRDWPTRFIPTPCGTSYFLFTKIDSHNFKKASTAILVFDGYLTGSIALALVAIPVVLLQVYFKDRSASDRGSLDSPLRRRSSSIPPAISMPGISIPLHVTSPRPVSPLPSASAPVPTNSPPMASVPPPAGSPIHGNSNPVASPPNIRPRRNSMSSLRQRRMDSINLWNQEPWSYQKMVECYPHLLAAAFNFVILIWTVLAIELPIAWNQISDVYSLRSTGQFIPFITGLSNLIVIGYKWYKYSEDDDEELRQRELHERENRPQYPPDRWVPVVQQPAVQSSTTGAASAGGNSAATQGQQTARSATQDAAASTSNNTGNEISTRRLRKRNTK